MHEVYEKMAELIRKGEEFVLAIVVNAESSTAGKMGFKMLVQPDGSTYGTVGGGALEKDVVAASLELFKTKGTKFKKYILKEGEESSLGMVCGGEIELYMEYIGSRPQLVIFGAGHIGKMLYKMADLSQDYDLIVIDERSDFANKENFPNALTFSGESIYEKVDTLPIRNGASAIIVTPGGMYDPFILKGLHDLKVKFNYVGMIGSTSRRDKCFGKARELGVSDDFLNSVFSPIGLAIEGETPFEISVAILGEVIALNKGVLKNMKTEKTLHKERKAEP
jgi:xanthine dehydrogenase accessory factor